MKSHIVRTVCTLDCPDACTLDVTVTDGVITDIDAAKDGDINPFTSGFICRKVQMSTKRIYSPERIATPLIRIGKKGDGEFRSASWDEALDLITSQIKEGIATRGVNSIAPYLYNSSSGIVESSGSTLELFARLGAPEIEHTICAFTYVVRGNRFSQGFHRQIRSQSRKRSSSSFGVQTPPHRTRIFHHWLMNARPMGEQS